MGELRAIISASGFLLFFLLGVIFPFRKNPDGWLSRVLNNVVLTVFNSTIVYWIGAGFLFELALQAQSNQWGLFAQTQLLIPVEIVLGLAIQDFVIYWQHRLFHAIPIFWRFHRVHHTDTHFDTSTSLRFHTFEIFLSLGVKALAVITFGLPPLSVIGFEIILNFSAMFNHGNFSLGKFDKWLRLLVVTPDMHRVHHTSVLKEINSNYGFCLSIWDRIFSSHLNSCEGIKTKNLGLDSFRSARDQRVDQLIMQPFVSKS